MGGKNVRLWCGFRVLESHVRIPHAVPFCWFLIATITTSVVVVLVAIAAAVMVMAMSVTLVLAGETVALVVVVAAALVVVDVVGACFSFWLHSLGSTKPLANDVLGMPIPFLFVCI